jgi:hypothetical protein
MKEDSKDSIQKYPFLWYSGKGKTTEPQELKADHRLGVEGDRR